MPRNQSTAAQRARQVQKPRDGKYTALLRAERKSPTARLAAALDAVELTHEAHSLRTALAPDPEWDAATAAYEAAYEAEDRALKAGAPRHVLDRLYEARVKATDQMDALCRYDDSVYEGDRAVCRAVLMGLAHAGRNEESPCLRPAADVLADCAEMALAWADGIRSFVPLLSLAGPTTPGPTAARAAYRALAEATQLPFKGDEEWTRCAELIEEAAALARAACR